MTQPTTDTLTADYDVLVGPVPPLPPTCGTCCRTLPVHAYGCERGPK